MERQGNSIVNERLMEVKCGQYQDLPPIESKPVNRATPGTCPYVHQYSVVLFITKCHLGIILFLNSSALYFVLNI